MHLIVNHDIDTLYLISLPSRLTGWVYILSLHVHGQAVDHKDVWTEQRLDRAAPTMLIQPTLQLFQVLSSGTILAQG